MPPHDPSPVAIKSTRVITPEGEIAAAIIFRSNRIDAVVPHAEVPESIVCEDFGDLVISPGVIDAHVHINQPGRTHWEGFASATAAAAAGGVTTLIDMPLNSSPVVTTAAALKTKRDAATDQCSVNVEFYGGLIPGNEIEIPGLIAGGVKGIKAFLCDSGLDEFPAAGETELRSVLPMLKDAGLPLLAHAEITSAIAQPIGQHFSHWPQTSYAAYADSRPESFELTAIELLIRLCKEFESPIHIVHLATAAALPMIQQAKAQGLPLTVETCPHYLYFCDDDIEDGQTQFKCAPPIRNAANRDALRAAVASGLIDTIGSDHSPCPPEHKHLLSGDFSKAWGGIASLQLTLPIMATIAKEENWTLHQLSQILSLQPAKTFGLGDRKGQIAIGFDADLIVWDPDSDFTVAGEELNHRHSITPYEGKTLTGPVVRTYVNGSLVFQLDHRWPADYEAVDLAHAPLAEFLNRMPHPSILSTLQQCCASSRWCEEMEEARPFFSDDDVFKKSELIWNRIDESDWTEAFQGHPQIGNVSTLRDRYADTQQIAGVEQSGVTNASEEVLKKLADGNRDYLSKFGFIFIVFATGKSAAQMLDLLQQRLCCTRQQELITAAAEQLKITNLRLKNLARE